MNPHTTVIRKCTVIRNTTPIRKIVCLAVFGLLYGCGGGNSHGHDSSSSAASSISSATSSITTSTASSVATDTSPNAFTFENQQDVAIDATITSNSLQITGINTAASITIIGGKYAIESGAFTATAGTISNNQHIRVQLQSSPDTNTMTSATLTIGGVSAIFSVTTLASNPRVIEAEDTDLLGGSAVMTNINASNHQVVGNLVADDAGIQFTPSVSSIGLKVTYAAESSGILALSVDNQAAGSLNLSASDSFITAELETNIPANTTVSLVKQAGDSDLLIDVIALIPSPLQQVSTFAKAGFSEGDGISVAADGSVYVSGGPKGKIIRISPQGVITTVISGYGYLADSDFDSAGNLYVADYGGSAIRRITPEGQVSTFASSLNGPASVYIDSDDNVYVGIYGANYSGTGASVIRITPEGAKTTYATGGGLKDVIGVVGDENGEIYAGNWQSGKLYRITNGTVSLLATAGIGINQIDYSRGYIYMANNSRIVRISTQGAVENFAGTSVAKTINGPLADAEFTNPNSLAFSADGNILYVYDATTGDIRKIAAAE